MEWTRRPKKSGWHWVRWGNDQKHEVVEVQLDQGFERFYTAGSEQYLLIVDYPNAEYQPVAPYIN